MKLTLVTFLIFTLCIIAYSQDTESTIRTQDQYVSTIAGELRISQRKDVELGFNVSLNGEVILRTDMNDKGNPYNMMAFVSIFSIYKGYRLDPNTSNEFVLLEFSEGGNACPSGNFRFLTLRDNKTYTLSNILEACSEPLISFDLGKAIFHFPKEPSVRGSGLMPAETWIFEKGMFKKLKASSVKNKTNR
jgi:hypothetical protein